LPLGGVHVPLLHVPPFEHGVPSAFAGLEQVPLDFEHVPTSWHSSAAVQVTGFEPMQTPALHASVLVHALLSSHVVPSALFGFEHVPLAGSQVPTSWHWSEALHTTGFDPAQTPAWQVFVWRHLFVPVQTAPSALAGLEHVPLAGSQAPTSWHGSEAVHTTGFMPVQAPPTHVSTWVQALPSLQVVPSALFGLEHMPLAGSHVPTL
jgi:hypothetical protein